jgi:hypothetical protein
MVMPLNRDGTAGGSARQITTGVWAISQSLDWTADGKAILFAGSAGSGNASLWRIAREGGKPVRFDAPSVDADEPTIARQSGRMIYVKRQIETRIFKMPVGPRGAAEPRPLVETEGDQRDLGVSPAGSLIAFTSNRTGTKEIWIANSDGSLIPSRTRGRAAFPADSRRRLGRRKGMRRPVHRQSLAATVGSRRTAGAKNVVPNYFRLLPIPHPAPPKPLTARRSRLRPECFLTSCGKNEGGRYPGWFGKTGGSER